MLDDLRSMLADGLRVHGSRADVAKEDLKLLVLPRCFRHDGHVELRRASSFHVS